MQQIMHVYIVGVEVRSIFH